MNLKISPYRMSWGATKGSLVKFGATDDSAAAIVHAVIAEAGTRAENGNISSCL